MNYSSPPFQTIWSGWFMNSTQQNSVILLLICFLLSINSYASSDRTRFLGDNLSIQANAITLLKLPVSLLSGSQLSNQEGMHIQFKNKGSINIHTLTNDSLNIEEFELSHLPLYLMGVKDVEKNTPSAQFIKQKVSENKQTYKPLKIASFRTPNGDGYLMIGAKQSVIYLTDRSNKSLITKIHIDTMSESDINNLLIKSLI